MTEIIHILPNRLNRNINIFLLFIPILIFILVLVLIVARNPRQNVATSHPAPTVLGEENP